MDFCMIGYEIERKFLLRPCSPRNFLDVLGVTYEIYPLEQYYLPMEKYRHIRYRRKRDRYFKTIKSSQGMIRNEEEYSVSREEYLEYHKEHAGRVIYKDRFVFKFEGVTYELDHFKKELKGLFYLEIEFDDAFSANAFILPPIFDNLFIAEVTEDSQFDNASLSQLGYIPLLQTNLEKLGRKMEIILPSQTNIFPLSVEPFESTETAILAIFQNNIALIRESQRVLIDDPKNALKLHNFWISIRKVRALMGEFEHILSPHWLERHRRNLSMMMAQTNTKRDLDIFLDSIEEYKREMSEKRAKRLEPMIELLIAKNRTLEPKIEGLANSELLDYEMESLVKPLSVNCKNPENLLQPMIITSIQILQRRIENIIKEGSKIDFLSKSQSHTHLRIQFKNLCAFVENTNTFIIDEKYNKAIELIKNMERVLGSCHDLEFQRLLLVTLQKEPRVEKSKTQKSIEELKKIISDLQQEKKILFKVAFDDFIAEKKSLTQLFHC